MRGARHPVLTSPLSCPAAAVPTCAGPVLGSVRRADAADRRGRDEVVLGLNRQAQARLLCESGLAVVPGATHLFEEPGTLLAAAELARDWFLDHFTP